VQEKTAADLEAISRHILCLSCSAPIVMKSDTMVSLNPRNAARIYVVRTPQIQHSHRHDDMQFMILTEEDLAKFSDYPVLPGVTAMLMKADERAKKLRSKVYFGCKHCVPNPRKFLACGYEPFSNSACAQSPPDRPELVLPEKPRSPKRNQKRSVLMDCVPI
jgi:hypothetical protein